VANPSMEMVDSSNIEAIGYDTDERELHVRFTSGRTYAYQDVPAEVYAELQQSDSKGSYLNREIRTAYAYREL
jgi:hypothetical protein